MPDVEYERRGPVAWLTVDRPPMNPLRAQTWQELGAALERAELDGEVRVVAVTGAGDRAFSVGGDLKEMRDFGLVDSLAEARRLQQLMGRFERCPKPTIAAVHGYALGGGFEVAAACTFRLASDDARFGVAEVDVGFVPALGACQRLVRLIGQAQAAELVLTGRVIDAHEAQRIGLVSRVVPRAELCDAVQAFGETLAIKPPNVLALTMDALRMAHEASSEAADLLSAALFSVSAQMEESREARRRLRERTRTKAQP